MRGIGRWMVVVLTLSGSLGGCVPVAGTTADGSGGGTAGGSTGISSSCSGGFGASAAAQKVATFVGAAATFSTEATALATTLTNTCRDMGTTLGLTERDMAPRGEMLPVEAACSAVASKVRYELSDLKVAAQLEVVVDAQPPVCEVSMEAYAQCTAECEVEIEPGQVELECTGGEIRGGCSATCSGYCALEARGQCTAQCEGTCSGECLGQCRAYGPNGECAGYCDGECRGTCQGSCVAQVDGQCRGECRGECSVEWERPRCTGQVRPPRASAECRAACDARLDARAECTPGYANVEVWGNVESNVEERLGRIRQALQAGLPSIRAAQQKLVLMRRAGQEMARAGRGLPAAVADVGVNAVSCVGQSLAAVANASVDVSVSIDVSASVAASASAG